ncbi:nuclease [Rhizobium rhizogenes]|uniref:Staphylococcus nuclease (SNase-like) n=1 Tax=Rhizobium rhizogenes (strain K84 / ATCC BAA-868) TaxID=311403 RepID=B9JPR1_RHIR8|nr:Staphylococcus nuclease (SNase-like) [Rhizobium rhizogenes K84]NTG77887.1 thermonuclease family protein [Rhizobium rhizogenes]
MGRAFSYLAVATIAALILIAIAAPVDAGARSAVIRTSVHATYCENSACEPVTLRIEGGDSFVIYRWGNHHEPVRIANIDAPYGRARCERERERALMAAGRLGQFLNGSTFTMARVGTDRRGNSIAFVSINRRDLGHHLVREQLVWPREPKHRFWC